MDRDPKVWLHPDEARCVGKQCDRAGTCARAKAPIPKQYAKTADFGLDGQPWRPCWNWLDASTCRPPTSAPAPQRHKGFAP